MIRIHRPVDLAGIDAVGFDLDHTLAIYDDGAVNQIAAALAREMLVERVGYPAAILGSTRAMETPGAARTLAADLVHGAVIKLSEERRVMHARLAGRWLDPAEIDRRFARALEDDPDGLYCVYSPFELPVLWMLEELETTVPLVGPRAARCADVRRMLDAAHTGGILKRRLRAQLPRFVAAPAGTAAALRRWSRAGKRLFVVTNSETDFASAVLERAVGAEWPDLFEVVVTSARKPAFFHAPPARAGEPLRATHHALILEGGCAVTLERLLGLGSDRILFVGDNVRSDIRAARAHGWRTVHVAPELAYTGNDGNDGWGAPLSHGGRPTWLARLLREADLACDDVGRFLSLDPSSPLAPGAAAAGESP